MVEALLYDVVAVEILNEVDNLTRQSTNNDLGLLLGRDELDHLL